MPNMDFNKSQPEKPDNDAERILRALEAQLASQRRSSPAGKDRTAFRIGSLALILILTIAALLALDWLAGQIPKPAHREPGTSVEVSK